MRSGLIALTIAFVSHGIADAQERSPSEWMLLLENDPIVVAPTTYSSAAECLMVLSILRLQTRLTPTCLPLHFPEDQVSAFMEQKEAAEKAIQEEDAAAAAALKKKREEIMRDRPALEAERREILDDRNKLNQQKYAKRVLEIDALLRLLTSPAE